MTSRSIASCLGLSCLLIACGPAALTISPGDQTVAVGSDPITLTATGGNGEYQWNLVPETGLGTLSASSGGAVTFTPVETVPSATTGVLTVTSGEDSTSVTLTVTPRAVHGRVVHQAAVKASGVMVALANADGTFTTAAVDAEGNFTFPSVPPRYDVVVGAPWTRTYTVYQGLTRLDPVLAAYGAPLYKPVSAARLSGTVSGGAFTPTQPALHTTVIAFESPDVLLVSPTQDTTDAAGAYSGMDVLWLDPATTAGTLHALQVVTDASGVPTGYPGYGTAEGVGLDNAEEASQDVVLAPVETVDFSFTATLPVGSALTTRLVYVQPGPMALLTVLSSGADPALSLPLPDLPGATVVLTLSATGTYGATTYVRTGLPLDSTGVVASLPAAPEVLTPAAGATGVTNDTVFSWADVEGATRMVQFKEATGTGLNLTVVTTATEITLPDLSGLGPTLSPNANYDWTLFTFFGMPDVDAFAANGGYLPHLVGGIQTQAATEVAASTYESTFTTAP